jgi:hypothetical protein
MTGCLVTLKKIGVELWQEEQALVLLVFLFSKQLDSSKLQLAIDVVQVETHLLLQFSDAKVLWDFLCH